MCCLPFGEASFEYDRSDHTNILLLVAFCTVIFSELTYRVYPLGTAGPTTIEKINGLHETGPSDLAVHHDTEGSFTAEIGSRCALVMPGETGGCPQRAEITKGV
jgi:hypothetical protein